MGFSFSRDVLGGPGTTGADIGAKLGDLRGFRDEIFGGPGGFNEQLAAFQDDPDLRTARRAIFDRSDATLDALRRDLISGALGQTSGGQIAALESARTAAGGRGGLAFGGGASRIAAAGARSVAPQQAAALGQALSQVGGLRLQAFQNQAAFAFNRRAQESQFRLAAISGLFSLGGTSQASLTAAQTAQTSAASAFSSTALGGIFGLGSAALSKKG